MPQFADVVVVPAGVEAVFAFFRNPQNFLRMSPPELRLEITAAPPTVELGARIEFKGRRWGVTHRTAIEITALEEGKLLTEVQRAGPFRKWEHVHRFEAIDPGTTRLTDEVAFEPPGGMLGLVVNAAFVERELTEFFRFRNQRLLELFRRPPDRPTPPT
jgi:ligand-binding SRPBCC domain-containing protein